MTARTRHLLIGAAALLVAAAGTGPVMAQGVYVNYYTPQFYIDHLVFYDETGAPIYYEGDTAYAVPSDYPEYDALVNHFWDNEEAYFRWFEEVGYVNLHHRRSPVVEYYKPIYYSGYMVFFEGGRPVYYLDGARIAISPSDRRHARLMRHYHQHRNEYDRWYRATGRHFRWYVRPVHTDYYSPLYFDGYVVFYDASGLPFYYRGGRTVFIPRTHREFQRYVSHYRSHRSPYDRWYQERGRSRHDYRQPKTHTKRVIAPRAPRASQGRAETRQYRPVVRPQNRPVIQPKQQTPPPVEPRRHDYRDRPGRPDRAAPPASPPREERPRHPPAGIREKDKKDKKDKEEKKTIKRTGPVIKKKGDD